MTEPSCWHLSVVLDLVDSTRTTPVEGDDLVAPDRSVPTDVYLPDRDEPAPLIVLAHGFDGHPDKFTQLASYWARAGYVVAVPRFPLSHRDVPVPTLAWQSAISRARPVTSAS